MYYVYGRYLASGRELSCGIYNTAKEAVERIAFLYQNDKKMYCFGEYYYFMKEH